MIRKLSSVYGLAHSGFVIRCCPMAESLFILEIEFLHIRAGLALGPALANIFVGFHESRLFNNTIKPGVYFRYVDDTFVIFGSELECDRFHVNLNQLHPALNFKAKAMFPLFRAIVKY